MPAFRGSFSMRHIIVALSIILLIGVSSQLLSSFPSPTAPAGVTAFGVANAQAEPAPTRQEQPAIEGWLTDISTGAAIENGLITLSDRIETHSGKDGYFSFTAAQVAQLIGEPTNEPTALSASVRASGYSEWSLTHALYYTGDTLRLYPRLAKDDQEPTEFAAVAPHPNSLIGSDQAPFAQTMSTQENVRPDSLALAPDAARLSPPATIRVYRTQSSTVEVVPFKDYVKHVLPLEWIPTWGAASLKAGAMAAFRASQDACRRW